MMSRSEKGRPQGRLAHSTHASGLRSFRKESRSKVRRELESMSQRDRINLFKIRRSNGEVHVGALNMLITRAAAFKEVSWDRFEGGELTEATLGVELARANVVIELAGAIVTVWTKAKNRAEISESKGPKDESEHEPLCDAMVAMSECVHAASVLSQNVDDAHLHPVFYPDGEDLDTYVQSYIAPAQMLFDHVSGPLNVAASMLSQDVQSFDTIVACSHIEANQGRQLPS